MLLKIIVVLVFFAIIGVMIAAVLHVSKNSTPKIGGGDQSLEDVDNAQDFLPFDDVKYSVIDLGNNQYRAVMEVQSINYDLLSAEEQDILEFSFNRFLTSLSFPIMFFVQTKVFDNAKRITEAKSMVDEALKRFPRLENYANQYLESMTYLPDLIGNDLMKKKYIIVPFDEIDDIQSFSYDEKLQFVSKELSNRCQLLSNGLANIRLSSKRLNTNEIVELIYSIYNRDGFENISQITNGSYLSFMVDGDVVDEEYIDDRTRIDWILYQAQSQLHAQIKENSPEINTTYRAIEQLKEIRDALKSGELGSREGD